MNRIKRLYHWFYARTHGYFWMPCPLCGKNFGGHETRELGYPSIMTSWGSGKMVCPGCDEVAKEYNKKWIKDNPHPG